MGSHIFKVDELCLNIDKEFMQEVCERVGFIPDPSIWNPPDDYIDFPLIDESDEKVQLLFAIEDDYTLDFQMNAGTFRMVVFGDGETIVHDENITTSARFQRTINYLDGKIASDGLSTLRVEFRAIASPILTFRSYNVYNLIAAYMNTPNLINLYYSFQGVKGLKKYDFFSDMPNIDIELNQSFMFTDIFTGKIPDVPNCKRITQILSYCSLLQKVSWMGTEYPNLEDIENMLNQDGATVNPINEFRFLESYPKLYKFNRAFETLKNLRYLFLPKYVDGSKEISFYRMLYGCDNIEYIEYPVNMESANIGYLYYGCKKIRKTFLPQSVPMWGNNIFYNAISIEKVKFLHNETKKYAPTNMCRGMTAVEEIEIMGNEALWTDMSNMFNGDVNLKSLKIPVSLPEVTSIVGMTQGCQLLTELHQITWPATPIRADNAFTSAMYIINQPTLRVTRFEMQLVTARNTMHIYIDWANSNFNTLTNAIILNNLQLDVTEIDRIFTALPSVSNNRNINVRTNPGTAACDATIATAKGWVVLK